MHRLRELLNSQAKDAFVQERLQIDEGESQEEEAGCEQHWDDTNLHAKGDQ